MIKFDAIEDRPRFPWPQSADLYEFNGHAMTLGEWASSFGLPYQKMAHLMHLHRGDMTAAFPERANKTALHPETIQARVPKKPTKVRASRAIGLTFGGETMTIRQWSVRLSVSEKTLRARLFFGWPIERVLDPKVAPTSRVQARAKRAQSAILATCDHEATDGVPGGGSRLSTDIGDRRGMVRAIEREIGVFAE